MLIVRKAIHTDLEELLKFEQGLIKAERPMDPSIRDGKINYYDLTQFIENSNSELFVAELDGEIVSSGYVLIKEDRSYLKHSEYAYLGFMYTKENHRGKGYNQLLTQALIEWAQNKGIIEIRLDVYDQNESAIKAYRKARFKNYLINMKWSPDS